MKKRILALLFGLLIYSVPLFAQTDTSGVTLKTLSNGVRLLLKPEAETQIVAVTAMVNIPPARTEQEAAVAVLVSRAMYYGSVNQSHKTMMQSVRQTGGKWEMLQTRNFVGVAAVLPSGQLGEALYFISDAFKNADFSASALESARQEILRVRKSRDAETFMALKDTVVRSFSPFAEPDEYLLKRVTPEQAQVYAQTQFTPQKLVISVVGKFNVEQTVRAVEMRFGNMKPWGAVQTNSMSNSPECDPTAIMTPKLPVGRAGYAIVATAAPDITHPDYPAFVVMQTVLGGGHSSRLWKRLRDDKGIGYGVGTFLDSEHSEPLIAYLQWDGTREFKAKDDRLTPLQLLNAQVDNLVIEPPIEAEVERARNVALGKHALKHERARDRAFALAWYETAGVGYQFDTLFSQKLTSVTRDDVLRVAKLYLPKRVTLLATPR